MKTFAAALASILILAATARAAEAPRVVILGFDGVDAQIVEEMLAKGELPNLAALEGEGRLFAADADDPGADAGVVGDVLDRPRPRRPRDLRFPETRSRQPHPDLRGGGGDHGPVSLRKEHSHGPGGRRGASVPPARGDPLRQAPAPGRGRAARPRRRRRRRVPSWPPARGCPRRGRACATTGAARCSGPSRGRALRR